MAIGTDLLFSDNFDRTDGELGADWEVGGVAGAAFAVSATLMAHTAGVAAGAKYAIAVGGVDNSDPNYKVNFRTDNVAIGAALLRVSDAGGLTGYVVGRNGAANYYFGRYDAGVLTTLSSDWIGSTWLNGVLSAEIENVGADVVLRLKSTINGTVVTFTDSSASKITTDGYYGLVVTKTATGSWFDDFAVYGVADVVNIGLRTPVIYEPNNDNVVADATGVRAIVRDAIGGAELLDVSDATIVAGVGVIDNDLVGVLGAAVDLEMRWTVGGQSRFICAPLTVIDLSL